MAASGGGGVGGGSWLLWVTGKLSKSVGKSSRVTRTTRGMNGMSLSGRGLEVGFWGLLAEL